MACVATDQHVYHGVFELRGKLGSLSLAVAFPRTGRRSWDVMGRDFNPGPLHSGQYDLLAGGHGEHVEAGGRKSSWYARLVGSVIRADRGPKQRVVIKIKGRPEGTFVLIPTQPGVLKRDSGTQSSSWRG